MNPPAVVQCLCGVCEHLNTFGRCEAGQVARKDLKHCQAFEAVAGYEGVQVTLTQ